METPTRTRVLFVSQLGENAVYGLLCQYTDFGLALVLDRMRDARASNGRLTEHLGLAASRFAECLGMYEQGRSTRGFEIGYVTQTEGRGYKKIEPGDISFFMNKYR